MTTIVCTLALTVTCLAKGVGYVQNVTNEFPLVKEYSNHYKITVETANCDKMVYEKQDVLLTKNSCSTPEKK